MPSRERIPNEIWLEIFRSLPRQALMRVHSTHRQFTAISRPLLFTHFTFHPYLLDIRGYFCAVFYDDIDLEVERLKFWSSEEIAPLVRQCTVAPLECSEAYILNSEFVRRISKFTGLRKLSATQLDLDSAALADICALPLLTDLSIVGCEVEDCDISDMEPLLLRRFFFRGSADRWIPLLDTAFLHELDLTGQLLHKTISAVSSFPRIHTLTATIDLSTASAAAFSKFPAVRILKLEKQRRRRSHPEHTACPSTSHILPLLNTYIGPHELLPLFLEKPTLKNLILDRCRAEELCLVLCTEAPHITSLHATFEHIDSATFETICTSFPGLVDLFIQRPEFYFPEDHERFYPEPAEFFSTLADSPLPRSLQRLAIALKWGELGHFELHSDGSPISVEGRKKLTERCPALTKLRLDGYDFLYTWRRGAGGGGLVQEQSTFGEGKSES
ncbi:hypothetical protein FB45DRAFT_1053392 [Roridomyces roridus]|uniref:F-box domain-containing protein n=1 Tax=Roridomyces roridus TaxID=1738132 RepID=A0AAD7FYY5_9AGAR|nr:hypothetical protein FB45DRAFT_1053392 [Roridomyces roridus]